MNSEVYAWRFQAAKSGVEMTEEHSCSFRRISSSSEPDGGCEAGFVLLHSKLFRNEWLGMNR